ncbi:MAG TPA: sensor histidine kinase [Methylovirgula sp.]|nr:sensor histidine kinase [Methylovirgula sp.]
MPLRLIANAFEPDGSLDRAVEAEHRIANNLALIASLVRMQSSSLPTGHSMPVEDVRIQLEEICARIETVGRLHRLLVRREGQTSVDLGSYLREISEVIVSSLANRERVLLAAELESCCITSPKQAVAVGLIVCEAITNSLKYAHPTGVAGKLQLGCRQAADGVAIEVTDDGVGLPEGLDPMTEGALGFRLMRTLAAQLGARLEFEELPIGLCVRITLPYEN